MLTDQWKRGDRLCLNNRERQISEREGQISVLKIDRQLNIIVVQTDKSRRERKQIRVVYIHNELFERSD